MKKLALIVQLLVLLPTSIYALKPVGGWYIGGGMGMSLSQENDNVAFPVVPNITTTSTTNNTVTYGVGIDGIGEIGYRKRPFRFELQTYFNLNNYEKLTLNDVDYPNSTTDLKGNANLLAEMVNVFYDHFSYSPDGASIKAFVPYIGAGIGFGQVSNGFGFEQAGTEVANVKNKTNTTSVYQLIIGGSMFFDDYSFGAIDYRYVSTGNIDTLNGPLTTSTFNLVFNFSFDGVKLNPSSILEA